MNVYALKSEHVDAEFDLFTFLEKTVSENELKLKSGDILVISSKLISFSQGRLLKLAKIKESEEGKKLSKKYRINPKLAEIIVRESDFILGGVLGFVITSSDDILAPNAGIDKSNTKSGVILYPSKPFLVAEEIRRRIFLKHHIHTGIIINDSRLMPARIGTVGVAIACAGLEPLNDLRSSRDLHGNPLKVTIQAVADGLATIANQKMGEGSESKPFAIIRDSGALLTDRKIKQKEMTISSDLCLYVRGLGKGFNTKASS